MVYENKETWPKEWGAWLKDNAPKMSYQSLYENFRIHFGIRNWKLQWMEALYEWFGVKPIRKRELHSRYKICFEKHQKRLGIKIKKSRKNMERDEESTD